MVSNKTSVFFCQLELGSHFLPRTSLTTSSIIIICIRYVKALLDFKKTLNNPVGTIYQKIKYSHCLPIGSSTCHFCAPIFLPKQFMFINFWMVYPTFCFIYFTLISMYGDDLNRVPCLTANSSILLNSSLFAYIKWYRVVVKNKAISWHAYPSLFLKMTW